MCYDLHSHFSNLDSSFGQGRHGALNTVASRLLLLRFRAGLLRTLEFPSALHIPVAPDTGIYSTVRKPPGLGDLPRQ